MPNDAVSRYSGRLSTNWASYQPHNLSAGKQIESTQCKTPPLAACKQKSTRMASPAKNLSQHA